METLSYWVSRLEPIIRAEGEDEIIVIFANRSGTEGSAVYAGTSAVLGIQGGEVKVYGILGRGERELLIVDTSKRPAAHLISYPNSKDDEAVAEPIEDHTGDLSDMRSSMSSGFTVESDDSTRCIDCEVDISTAPTSADLVSSPLDNCCLTPTSPLDSPFPQSYFGSIESPSNAPMPDILPPDNIQQKLTPSPTSDIFGGPESPEKRNATRSRGPSPHESDAVPVTDVQSSRTDGSGGRPSRADFVVNRVDQSASVTPLEQEYSFTKNSLGPRNRHISPRPLSTIW
jgi:protein N-terminal amidase